MLSLLLTLIPPALPDYDTIVVTNVTVIDCTGAPPKSGQDVRIEDGKIVSVNPTGGRQAPIKRGTLKVLQGKGKYLIPGLWDMHVHPDDPELVPLNPKPADRDLLLPLFVLNGVTTVRDMGGSVEAIKDWKKRIGENKLLGPRFFFGGPLVDGPKPMWPASIAVTTPEDGREAVRKLKADGVDFIKVYSLIQKEPFLAVIDEAKKQGLPVVGHKPDVLTNIEASNAGMTCIEHMLGFPREFLNTEKYTAIRNAIPQEVQGIERRNQNLQALLECHDPGKEQEVYQTFVRNGSWHTPTIAISFANSFFEELLPKEKDRFKYLPSYLRGWWTPEQNVHLQNRDPKALQGNQKLSEHMLKYIGAMHKAGVKLMTGTDMGGNPLCWAGYTMFTELEYFVKAGIPPMDALICATANPAKFMGQDKVLGTIEVGKISDLVLIDGDPIADISNVSRVNSVVQGRKAWDRKELDGEFKKLEEACAKT